MDYSGLVSSDDLVDLPSPDNALYQEGGGPTQIYDRWQQKQISVKKYVDDVSGVEKLHASHQYNSKILNGVEHRMIHAEQSQFLFDQVVQKSAE